MEFDRYIDIIEPQSKALTDSPISTAHKFEDSGPLLCQFCPDSAKACLASCVCLNCNDTGTPMCSDCFKSIHVKYPVFKGHKVLSTRKYLKYKEFGVKCSVHLTQDLTWICKDCSIALCPSCFTQSHDGHVIEVICDAVKNQREELQTQLPELRAYLDNLASAHEKIESAAAEIEVCIKSCLQELLCRREEVQKALGTLTEGLLDSLTDDSMTTSAKYDEEIEFLGVQKSTVKSCITIADTIVNKKPSCEAYALSGKLKTDLTSVMDLNPMTVTVRRKQVIGCWDNLPALTLSASSMFEFSSMADKNLNVKAGTIGFGKRSSANGQFSNPWGVHIHPATTKNPGGLLFISDEGNHRVTIFDATTYAFLKSIGSGKAGTDNTKFNKPGMIASLHPTIEFPDGLLYVVDFLNNRVQVFDMGTMDYIFSITKEFKLPWGVEVMQPTFDCPTGLVFITDGRNHCVKVFEATTFKYRSTIGKEGKAGNDVLSLNQPKGLAICDNLLYVADGGNTRVNVFDAINGTHVRVLGKGRGTGLGQFTNTNGVAYQNKTPKYVNGAIYVADHNNKRVVIFDKLRGHCCGVLPGTEGKSCNGISTAIDSDGNSIVFVSHYDEHIVQVYEDS